MTKITINKDVKLSKTHFADLEELQEEILYQLHTNFELSDQHKEILDQRLNELDNGSKSGKSWSEVRSNLKRKNA